MPESFKNFSIECFAEMRTQRMLLWLVSLVLALQLIGTARHQHALTEQSADCVSCYFPAHFPSDLPMVDTNIVPAPVVVAYQVAPFPIYFSAATRNYLIPLSQAPPA